MSYNTEDTEITEYTEFVFLYENIFKNNIITVSIFGLGLRVYYLELDDRCLWI